ncbi:MAG: ACP S-malonyltransferase [Bacteroidales bacterium]
MIHKRAFIFPAFITDYTQKEIETIASSGINFKDYINRASNKLGIDLPEFSYSAIEYKKDELLAQIIAYIFSCAFADLLKKKDVKPDFVAGYSMGIYASLYAAGSIKLEDGIQIIFNAFKLVNELSCSGKYGMGGVIGLSNDDISQLINQSSSEIEIINTNSEFSHVIAGKKHNVNILLGLAKAEGALNAVEFNVKTPYHSKYLSGFADRFAGFINTLEINTPQFLIISTYDQRTINSVDEIRKELVYNLTSKINWYKTMQMLLNDGVNEFYECGSGKDLSKIARFIDGTFKFIPINKL